MKTRKQLQCITATVTKQWCCRVFVCVLVQHLLDILHQQEDDWFAFLGYTGAGLPA